MIMRYLVSSLSQCTVVYCVVAELVKRYYFMYLVGWRKHWLFVAIRYNRIRNSSRQLVSVYMPAMTASYYFSEYLQTLGELDGFIEFQQCDVNILVGDFNVDFDRGGPLAKLLCDLICDLNLIASDLSFHHSIKYTFERGDGLARSWIDHVICYHRCLLVMYMLFTRGVTCLITLHCTLNSILIVHLLPFCPFPHLLLPDISIGQPLTISNPCLIVRG